MTIKARLTALEDLLQVEKGEAWPAGGGLASLLAYAERNGIRDLSPIADDDLPQDGMGALLREARAWQRAQGWGGAV